MANHLDVGAYKADTLLLLQAKQEQQDGSIVLERAQASNPRSRLKNLHQKHKERADPSKRPSDRETANSDELSESKGA